MNFCGKHVQIEPKSFIILYTCLTLWHQVARHKASSVRKIALKSLSNWKLHYCPVSSNVFLSIWFGLVRVLSNTWPQSLLMCLFRKKLRIWEKKSSDFCQTDNPRFSFIIYCYIHDISTTYLKKSRSKRIQWSQRRGNPWLSALGMFHNNIYLLDSEVRRLFSPGTSLRSSLCLLLWLW